MTEEMQETKPDNFVEEINIHQILKLLPETCREEGMTVVIITHNTAIAAQTLSLAPADGKLYALRDVTSTVDIIPMIASSVVSKKIASGANHIVLDVKYGSGAFIKTPEEAQKLSEVMVEVGKRLNRNICAVISSMNQPLGRAVGNSVEIQEVIEFLKGNMESDLKEITYTLCQTAFEKAGKFTSKEEAYKYLDELITSGKALEKFREIVKSQGGDYSIIEYYKKLKRIREAIKSGRIKDINEYMLNLLTIIEKLNELNLIYYDIHDNNVLVDENGKPFLIDIDDIVTIPSIEDFYQQSQYLTEFILNVYLEEYKTLRVHISDKELRKILSQKVISYMENLTVIANPAPSLPYVLLDELKDKEKVLKLKNKNI